MICFYNSNSVYEKPVSDRRFNFIISIDEATELEGDLANTVVKYCNYYEDKKNYKIIIIGPIIEETKELVLKIKEIIKARNISINHRAIKKYYNGYYTE